MGLIAWLIVYPLGVLAVTASWIAGLPWWGAIGVAIVAAAIWLYPASRLVRWMARPD